MVHTHSPDAASYATDSLPTATKADVEAHFATHGTGEITEVKLMNGFGFIEYKDPMDARDVVPGKLLPSPPSALNTDLCARSLPYVTTLDLALLCAPWLTSLPRRI
ncbi:uncharacterized protein AUP68_11542 [Ilyonectria robusta]